VERPDGTVLLSGQKAWDMTGRLVAEDITAQTHRVLDNIEAILGELGLGLDDVARVQCHLADVDHYDAFNAVYEQRLGAHRPARTTLGGAALRGGALVELVVDAWRRPLSPSTTQ
jgi:2-iminobutanoate/2-iminopropanoate deaminase